MYIDINDHKISISKSWSTRSLRMYESCACIASQFEREVRKLEFRLADGYSPTPSSWTVLATPKRIGVPNLQETEILSIKARALALAA